MPYSIFHTLVILADVVFVIAALYLGTFIIAFARYILNEIERKTINKKELREMLLSALFSFLALALSIFIIFCPYIKKKAKAVVKEKYKKAMEFDYSNTFNEGNFSENNIAYKFKIINDIDGNSIVKITQDENETHLFDLKTGEEIQ